MALWYYDGGGFAPTSWARRDRLSDAFICCPGPSLRDMGLSAIRGPGSTVVALTTAYPLVYPDLWFGVDPPECYDSTLWFQPFPKVTTNWRRRECWGGAELSRCPGMFYADAEETHPGNMFSRMGRDVTFVYPRNTFWFSIHVLLWMGFRRLHFVGCDMGGDKDYCHDSALSDDKREFNRKLYSKLTSELEAGSKDMKRRGIELFSCTPASPINNFLDYVPLDKAIAATRKRYALPANDDYRHCREIDPGRPLPKAYHIKGYKGLGDTIYMLPFIRNFARQCKQRGDDLYVSTPWPQLMRGIPAKLVQDHCGLRAQESNLRKHLGDYEWHEAPAFAVVKPLSYDGKKFRQGRAIVEMLNECLPLNGAPLDMHLEIPDEWVDAALKITRGDPFILARPVTMRRTSPWMAHRNCRQEYIQRAVDAICNDIEVVSFADCNDQEYLPEGPLRNVHFGFDDGELPFETMMGMAYLCRGIVAPCGFPIALGVALGKPTLIFYGCNEPPKAHVDPEMDLSKLICAVPEPFCWDGENRPDANKTIPHDAVERSIQRFKELLCLSSTTTCSSASSDDQPTATCPAST